MKLADPSEMRRGPRRFVAYLIRDIAQGFDKRGFLALVPVALIVSVGCGVLVARFASPTFWDEMQNVIAFYAAGLAVNAILLAVCWASFARIFETLSDPDFGAWMRLRKLDGYYGWYVDFIHAAQMLAVALMAVGLGASLVSSLPPIVDRVMLGAAIATSVYAARWAAGCVRIMQDLADYRVKFREASPNVATLSRAEAS